MKYSNRLVQIVALTIFSLLLILRRDGFFPFNSETNDWLMIIISTLHIILFAILLCIFFKPQLISKRISNISLKLNYKILLSLTITLYLAVTFILFYKDYKAFSDIYAFNFPIVALIFLTSWISLIIPILKSNPKVAFISLLGSSILISLIPIIYFPITSKIGDLMPIIIEQSKALLAGENIYQYYLLDNGVWTQAVRQPGTVLAYLPAVLLNIDLRFLSVLYTVLTSLIIIKLAYKKFRSINFDNKFFLVYIILVILVLSPYRLGRLDLYEPPFWFLLSLSLYFLANKRNLASVLTWSVGIFTQVWFWLFTPFFILYLAKTHRLKHAIFYSLAALIPGLGMLLTFVLRDPSSYYEHVFGFYRLVIELNHYNNFTFYLTPWFIKLEIRNLLSIVQFTSIAILGLAALRYMRSFKVFIAFISFALFVFIQFNSLSWNYMYLNLILLMSIYLANELRD